LGGSNILAKTQTNNQLAAQQRSTRYFSPVAISITRNLLIHDSLYQTNGPSVNERAESKSFRLL